MNTTSTARVPMLKRKGVDDYVFIFEELELAFERSQLVAITQEWNEGKSLRGIAKKYKRHHDEVFLAIFHQARKGEIKRPIARRLAGT